MKRKRIAARGTSALKWHTVLFIVVTVGFWLSALATFEYPDNAALPFEMFKTFIVERIWFNILWAIVLLAHFGMQEIREFLLQRAYNTHLNSFSFSDNLDNPPRKNSIELEEDDEVMEIEDEPKQRTLFL